MGVKLRRDGRTCDDRLAYANVYTDFKAKRPVHHTLHRNEDER
jgi:hypothetical protein